MSRIDSSPADALVLFGATGDLARKKIYPAVWELERRGGMGLPVVGVSGSSWSDEDLHNRVHESLAARGSVDEEAFADLASRMRYVSGDYRQPET
ncbi:MAG: glucose-6-phosphate dehydrogenase, partial [Acidimicrobiales bacterium]